MAEKGTDAHIWQLNVDLLTTLASLGDFVVAQNGALIEMAKLLSNEINERGEQDSLGELSDSLNKIKQQSYEYVASLKTAVARLQGSSSESSDA